MEEALLRQNIERYKLIDKFYKEHPERLSVGSNRGYLVDVNCEFSIASLILSERERGNDFKKIFNILRK